MDIGSLDQSVSLAIIFSGIFSLGGHADWGMEILSDKSF